MYPTWSFATSPRPTKPDRSRRLALTANVQVFLRFEAWQLGWTLKAVNISETGVLANLEVSTDKLAQHAADLEILIEAEPHVRLQIDHGRTHLYSPVVSATLVRSTRSPHGLTLAFQFLQPDAFVYALLDDLLRLGADDKTSSQ